MEAVIVSTEPQLVVEVENLDGTSEGDSIYTVIPEQQYCGCWDARARDVICKHQLFVYHLDGELGDAARDILRDELDAVKEAYNELYGELNQLNGVFTLYEDGDDEATDEGAGGRGDGTIRSLVNRVR